LHSDHLKNFYDWVPSDICFRTPSAFARANIHILNTIDSMPFLLVKLLLLIRSLVLSQSRACGGPL
jgi:hypothetical protein